MIATAALATVTVIPALVLLGRDPKVMASAREPRDQVFNQSSSLA
jgi:hypothetical protein